VTYKEALAFLDSLVNYERQPKPRDEFKLDNLRRALDLAGNPEKKIRNVILIAGTKGKGSVSYMIEAGLRGCGLKTGLFVSPHLVSVRERMQLNGQPVEKRIFARLMASWQPLVRRMGLSYFETLTAMAFRLFTQEDVDYAVVEVGLGGRLDATNLSEPAVAVITRIGYDHIQVLGSTLTRIAREKAGIMRAGKPVVIGPQSEEAKTELKRQAEKTGAVPVWVEERTRVWDELIGDGGLSFSCFTELGAGRVELKVLGRHQVENCRIALTVLGIIARQEPRVKFEPAVKAIAGLVIPGRCQIVRKKPLLIVDSCHNPESGAALGGVLRDYLKEKVILIYGSLRKKLVKRTLAPIAPWVDTAIVVSPDSPRAMTPGVLKGILRRLGVFCETAPNLPAALKRAEELAVGRLPIVIAGSFYLAGAALALLTGRDID